MLMIYNPAMYTQIGVAKYAAQIYLLGASVHVAIRLLGAKRHAELHKAVHPGDDDIKVAEIIQHDIEDVRELAILYSNSSDRVVGAAKHQLEVEMHEELRRGMFKINTPELRERNAELLTTLLGGEDVPTQTMISLRDIMAGASRFQNGIREGRTH